MAAALELIADLRGQEDQPLQLFIGTAVLIALAFVRTARLLGSEDRVLRELASARDAALEASRAKTLFVANVSHGIRTPLTTVLAERQRLRPPRAGGRDRRCLSLACGPLVHSLPQQS